MPKQEDTATACLTLVTIMLELAKQAPSAQRDGALEFALYDLATKARDLRKDISRSFSDKIRAALSSTQNDLLLDVVARFDTLVEASASSGRVSADVVILTVIPVERDAVLKTFGIDRARADENKTFVSVGNRRFYSAKLPVHGQIHRKRHLQLYIGMVGEPRNVPCANVCRDIFERIDADLIALVGIGGGNPDLKIKQGDVIGALGIYYIEGGKKKIVKAPAALSKKRLNKAQSDALRGILRRVSQVEPEVTQRSVTSPAKEYLQQFTPGGSILAQEFQSTKQRYQKNDFPPGKRQFRPNFRYYPGQVMCGEKVIVDNSLKGAAREINRKMACVDMESYGFSETCAHKGWSWIVFRGISDFANPKKHDGKHVSASIAAAVTAKLFLIEGYIEREAREAQRL